MIRVSQFLRCSNRCAACLKLLPRRFGAGYLTIAASGPSLSRRRQLEAPAARAPALASASGCHAARLTASPTTTAISSSNIPSVTLHYISIRHHSTQFSSSSSPSSPGFSFADHPFTSFSSSLSSSPSYHSSIYRPDSDNNSSAGSYSPTHGASGSTVGSMSGIAIKITSLLIRTVSKPIANRIKAQAREHEGFRRICVGWAQYLHRVDMRLRLGLLNDPAKYERQAAREAADAARKRREAETPTVKTEKQTKADEEAAARKGAGEDHQQAKKEDSKPKIKPLSEAKAIDMGANFIAESFLFAVAVGTLFFDQYRSRKKETSRRNDVAEKLAELEERDEVKNGRIEELERQIRDLKGHESWSWPWRRGEEEGSKGKTGGEGRATVTTAARELVAEKKQQVAQELQTQVQATSSSSFSSSSPQQQQQQQQQDPKSQPSDLESSAQKSTTSDTKSSPKA